VKEQIKIQEIRMDIFVGNLSFDATQGDLKKLFGGFGNVISAVIVTREEKNAPKSRGFGFVQMPDEQQALAAIAALHGKEFMGRVLDVSLARSKAGAPAENKLKEKKASQGVIEVEPYFFEETEEPKLQLKSAFNKPGIYKGGRRAHSYIKRRGIAGMRQESRPQQRSQDNLKRWRKKEDKPKSWQKSPGEYKPWKKVEGGARPWKKTEGGSKPWSKRSSRMQKKR